jgi:hypothetical protein
MPAVFQALFYLFQSKKTYCSLFYNIYLFTQCFVEIKVYETAQTYEHAFDSCVILPLVLSRAHTLIVLLNQIISIALKQRPPDRLAGCQWLNYHVISYVTFTVKLTV